MNESDLYKNSGITIDEKWIEELDEENINENYDLSDYIEKESNEESDDEKFSEIDESESHVGNVDTLLDKIDEADLANNTGFIFAPGEGQRPISLYNDPDAEFLLYSVEKADLIIKILLAMDSLGILCCLIEP
jgi:hypothetical protein